MGRDGGVVLNCASGKVLKNNSDTEHHVAISYRASTHYFAYGAVKKSHILAKVSRMDNPLSEFFVLLYIFF